MFFLIKNKVAKTIFYSIQFWLKYNGFPEEIGADNRKKFKNKLIEKYLTNKICN